MSILTLAANITTASDPFYTKGYTYDTPGDRLAVPLTIVWSLPTDCTDTLFYKGVLDTTASCSPPCLSDILTYDGYYSPGACVSGYTVGCVAGATVTSVNFEPIKPSETVGFCVPR